MAPFSQHSPVYEQPALTPGTLVACPLDCLAKKDHGLRGTELLLIVVLERCATTARENPNSTQTIL